MGPCRLREYLLVLDRWPRVLRLRRRLLSLQKDLDHAFFCRLCLTELLVWEDFGHRLVRILLSFHLQGTFGCQFLCGNRVMLRGGDLRRRLEVSVFLYIAQKLLLQSLFDFHFEVLIDLD